MLFGSPATLLNAYSVMGNTTPPPFPIPAPSTSPPPPLSRANQVHAPLFILPTLPPTSVPWLTALWTKLKPRIVKNFLALLFITLMVTEASLRSFIKIVCPFLFLRRLLSSKTSLSAAHIVLWVSQLGWPVSAVELSPCRLS